MGFGDITDMYYSSAQPQAELNCHSHGKCTRGSGEVSNDYSTCQGENELGFFFLCHSQIIWTRVHEN